MQTKIKFPAKRLLLSLYICSCTVIFLQNINLSENKSYFFDLLSITIGFLIVFLFFIPSMIIKKCIDIDFLSYAHIKTPAAIIFISAFYGIYFVYTAEYFLLSYTDMFSKKLNPQANIYVVALILLVVCAYAAYKGVNAITRCAIFIFVFSLLAFAMFYIGNISNLNFSHYGFSFEGNMSDLISNTSNYLTVSFIAVIFGSVSGYTDNFKIRHIVYTLILTALIFAVTMFFIRFALGDYAVSQEYPAFVLSKASNIGSFRGMDAFYLSLTVLSIFLIISLILSSISKLSGESSSIKIILIFLLIIFVMYICANNYYSVKEILTNSFILNVLSSIAAIIIPTAYLLVFGRRKNV